MKKLFALFWFLPALLLADTIQIPKLVLWDNNNNAVRLSATKNGDGSFSLATVGTGNTTLQLSKTLATDTNQNLVRLSAFKNNDGSYSLVVTGTGGGGGATIPSTTNLIKGDGAGNGADSGIVPANVLQSSNIGITIQGWGSILDSIINGDDSGLSITSSQVSGNFPISQINYTRTHVSDPAGGTVTVPLGDGIDRDFVASVNFTVAFSGSPSGSHPFEARVTPVLSSGPLTITIPTSRRVGSITGSISSVVCNNGNHEISFISRPSGAAGALEYWEADDCDDSRQTFSNANVIINSGVRQVAQTGTMSAARTATIPSASAYPNGYGFYLTDESGTVTATNKITASRSGSDTINGGNTLDIITAFANPFFVSDGVSKWTVDVVGTTRGGLGTSTSPTTGQIPIGGSGMAYAPQTISGSGATITLNNSGVLTISSIPNASLSNSAITIAGTSTSLGGTITLDTILNSPGSVAQGDILYYNGTDWVYLTPGTTGQFLKTQGASANPVWATVSGGGGTPGGSNTQVQYNNSSAFGGITNATSDGTTLTLTSPKIVTALNDTNGNTLFNITATASALFGINLTNAAAGGTVDFLATTPTQTTGATAGTPLKVHSSDAVAGSSTVGAATGGLLTLQAGDAKRLTSGSAAGGAINIYSGVGIGGSSNGVINLLAGGGGGAGWTVGASGALSPSAITVTFTPGQTGGIVGTTTNNSVQAGSVGESVSSLIASGSAVSLTTATAANVTSISLTAGDWDVGGNVNFNETTSTVTARTAGISSTSATLPNDGTEGYCGVQSTVTTESNTITLTRKRFSLSGTTTIYLVGSATFSAGTCAEFGAIYARRVR